MALAGLFCAPMSFRNSQGLYMIFGPGLLVTLSVMSVLTWRSKSRSIVKSFILGTFCMLIPSLIWPYGHMFYMAMTSSIFRSAIGGGVYLKISLPLLVASVYGGLIGIVFATGFSKKTKQERAMGLPRSDRRNVFIHAAATSDGPVKIA
ncbi:MAG: hypothetical protein VX768_21315 [Planctomycetota bacterium]|nr:hypothetical protein [Planctomycetota bacterium]